MKGFKSFSVPAVLILVVCIILLSCEPAVCEPARARSVRRSVRIRLKVVRPVKLNIDARSNNSEGLTLTDNDLEEADVTKTEYADQNGRVILYTKVSDY